MHGQAIINIIMIISGHLEYMNYIAMAMKLVYGIAHTQFPIQLDIAVPHNQDKLQSSANVSELDSA